MLLKENEIFDSRYNLKQMLGRGGFSEVWLVEDTKVGNKKMALKIYAPGMGLDDDGVKLFSSEFELVYDLNHSYLLKPSHFDVYERSPYLVLPYCENGSAAKSAGRMTEKEAWSFLHDVASGLAYLHEQKEPIIHQDIKPDNVLIDHNGKYLITDFGISSKARSTLRKSVGETKAGGTIAYMPPERFGKDNTPIKASDVWALGATLYELLTGDVPFGEHGGLIQKSGAEIPDLGKGYSKEMQKVVEKMLAVEPWNRPRASQIVEWTENYLKGKETFGKNKSSKGKYLIAAAITVVVAIGAAWIALKPDNKPAENIIAEVPLPIDIIGDLGDGIQDTLVDNGQGGTQSLPSPQTPQEPQAAATHVRTTPANINFPSSSATRTINVATDGASYEVSREPAWVSVTNKTSASFEVRANTNTGAARTGALVVTSGSHEARVSLEQAAAAPPPESNWRQAAQRRATPYTISDAREVTAITVANNGIVVSVRYLNVESRFAISDAAKNDLRNNANVRQLAQTLRRDFEMPTSASVTIVGYDRPRDQEALFRVTH